LEIIDVTNPAAPVHKGRLQGIVGASSVYVSGSYAYVTSSGDHGLEIIDVTNPAVPVRKASLTDGTDGALLDTPNSVFVSGNYAYVACSGSYAIEIVFLYSPSIFAFTPSGAIGSSVTITGQNFNTFVSAAINGTPAIVSGVTATTLTVTVPPGASIGPISVSYNGSKVNSANNFIVTPTSLPDTNVQQTSFNAIWSDVGAAEYFLDVSKDNFNTFVDIYHNFSLDNITSFTIEGLSPGTTYQYRVRSSDGVATSTNSNTTTVLTLPITPVANEATSISQTGFTANWTSSPGASGYYLDVASDVEFNRFLVGYNNRSISGVSLTSRITGLESYTNYYYRVRAATPSSSSSSSNVVSVLTLDVTPPNISAPATPNPSTLLAGVDRVFNSTITDNVSVDSAKIFYRGISQKSFKNALMQGPGGTGGNYFVTVQPGWFDALGLEYYFLAKDKAGNNSVTESSYVKLVNPSISIPEMPTGTSQSDYRIVAFPYQLATGNKVTNVYPGIPWNDNTKAAMWWWNSALGDGSGSYEQYGSATSFQTIEPGKGYWAIVGTPASPQLSNVEAPEYNRSNLYQMTLLPKWNEIGNPYPVSISWADVIELNRKINPNALFSPLSIYDGTGYKNATELKAFEGGFVKNLGSSDIIIQIPFSGQTSIGGRVGSIGSDISQDTWNIFLHIDQEGFANQLGGFGMHPLAQSGPDRFDNFNPPRFMDIPEVNFMNPESGASFSNDMVKAQENYTWEFTPSGSLGKPAQLNWEPGIVTNSSKQLFLLDEERINLIDMGSANQYNFTLTSASSFRIFYGSDIQDKITTQRIAVGDPYPNPLRNDALLNINFALPESPGNYTIDLQLYNGQGVLIESLNKTLSSGVHQLEFSLADQTLTSGIYIYRVAVSSEKLSTVHAGKIVRP
jgi:hypothetical protein